MSADNGTYVLQFDTPTGPVFRVLQYCASMGVDRKDWVGKPLIADLGQALLEADKLETENPTEYGISRMIIRPVVLNNTEWRAHLRKIQGLLRKLHEVVLTELGSPLDAGCKRVCECGHYCRDHAFSDSDHKETVCCTADGCECSEFFDIRSGQ